MKNLELSDTNGWLVRLNAAAERQTAEIRKRGARNFQELLMVLEADHCTSCDGKVISCKIAAFIANHGYWRRSEFCPKCFGRFAGSVPSVDKDGNKLADRPLYKDSEFYTQMRGDGKGLVIARCNCKAAIQQYGDKMPEAQALSDGLCAVKQRILEEAMRDSAVKRWRKEIAAENRPCNLGQPSAPLPETGGDLDYNLNPVEGPKEQL